VAHSAYNLDIGELPLWTRMILHLDGLKRIPHFDAHVLSASRSLYMWGITLSNGDIGLMQATLEAVDGRRRSGRLRS